MHKSMQSALVLVTSLLLTFSYPAFAARIIYVDDDAAGPGDGSSWNTAYRFLQDALADANTSTKPIEIRVAAGTYRPDKSAADPNGTGDRNATFHLINGIALQGGYAGATEPDPNARDINLHQTILDGDLAANDTEPTDWSWQAIDDVVRGSSRSENSYSVVTASGTDSTAVLDGFTITAGHADSCNIEPGDCYAETNSPRNNGAGMYIHAGSPTLIHCTFQGNCAQVVECAGAAGGGIFASNSNPVLLNCNFIENIVFGGNWSSRGGGMCNINSNPTLTNCLFKRNIAMGYDSEYYGGAIDNHNSSPTITDCTFIENRADWGGAISNSNGSPTIIRCTFTGNSVNDNGGAIITGGGQPTLTDCTFAENSAYTYGGAVCSASSQALNLTNCTFTSNHASDGGAIYSDFRDNITLANCTFNANSAIRGGAVCTNGAWYNDPNSATLIAACSFSGNSAYEGAGLYSGSNRRLLVLNCTLTGNRASQYGGGLYCYGSQPSILSCTFAQNLAKKGTSLACDWEPSVVQLINSILWDGGNEVFDSVGSTIDVTFCDVRSGYAGAGNLDVDPCFAAPGRWDPNGTTDDPNDDFWVNGDYHLKSQAGRWDPDSNSWVKDDVTSPCIDAGDPMSPIGYEHFPNGGRINMGAYGGTAQASKSWFGGPVCETIVAGDINGDCKVDFSDFTIMALHWLNDYSSNQEH